MQASFRIAADLALEVEANPRLGCVHLRAVDPNYQPEGEGVVRHVEREIPLSKSEARSLASALMGAAGEL